MKVKMCNCITNTYGVVEFCSILCRDYYINNKHPELELSYLCKWCNEKTLIINSCCCQKCYDNETDRWGNDLYEMKHLDQNFSSCNLL